MTWNIKCYFEPRDVWVGVYWKHRIKNVDKSFWFWDIYICVIPCLPVRIFQGIKFKGED